MTACPSLPRGGPASDAPMCCIHRRATRWDGGPLPARDRRQPAARTCLPWREESPDNRTQFYRHSTFQLCVLAVLDLHCPPHHGFSSEIGVHPMCRSKPLSAAPGQRLDENLTVHRACGSSPAAAVVVTSNIWRSAVYQVACPSGTVVEVGEPGLPGRDLRHRRLTAVV